MRTELYTARFLDFNFIYTWYFHQLVNHYQLTIYLTNYGYKRIKSKTSKAAFLGGLEVLFKVLLKVYLKLW